MKIYLLKDIFSLYFLLLNCGKYHACCPIQTQAHHLLKNIQFHFTFIFSLLFFFSRLFVDSILLNVDDKFVGMFLNDRDSLQMVRVFIIVMSHDIFQSHTIIIPSFSVFCEMNYEPWMFVLLIQAMITKWEIYKLSNEHYIFMYSSCGSFGF